jgi:hypothetical protein
VRRRCAAAREEEQETAARRARVVPEAALLADDRELQRRRRAPAALRALHRAPPAVLVLENRAGVARVVRAVVGDASGERGGGAEDEGAAKHDKRL